MADTSTFSLLISHNSSLLSAPNPQFALERITDSEMQGKTVLELGNIIVSRLTGIIRIVQPHSTIQTENQKVHIITQTGSRTQSYLHHNDGFEEFSVLF